MSDNLPITIKIKKDLLRILDEQVLKQKHSQKSFNGKHNRSAYIEEALIYYFKIRLGIPFIVRKR